MSMTYKLVAISNESKTAFYFYLMVKMIKNLLFIVYCLSSFLDNSLRRKFVFTVRKAENEKKTVEHE